MGGHSSKDNVIEAYACRVDEMKDGDMREIEIGNYKALLVRDKGEFSAIGPKCTHFGAPLVKGSLKNGTVRCPWHGACFNIKTGDIEDYPGLDCIPKHEVLIQDGDKVTIRANTSALINHKRYKPIVQMQQENGPHILIIGGGPTSVTCAETLRQKSFTGTITIATMESYLPYDRTKLSKNLEADPESLYLRPKQFYDAANIRVLLRKCATDVNIEDQSVAFDDGDMIFYDQLMLASGGRPRTLPIPGWDLKNVYVLRSPNDALAISNQAKNKHVVIFGASFIGMELASTLVSKAKSVSVCEFFSVPFERVLGIQVGEYIKQLHEMHGVHFYMNASVVELQGERDEVKRAILRDGSELKADLVIAGIGIIPATEYLRTSGVSLTSHGFVNVNRYMRALRADTKEPIPNVYAGGDIAMFPQRLRDWQPSNIQHYQMAHYHGKIAGTNMVVRQTDQQVVKSVPFFWTQQYGKSLRYTGYGVGYDDIVITGKINEGKFCAYYTSGNDVIAVATLMSDPVAADVAQYLLAGQRISKSDILNKRIGNNNRY